MRLCLLDASGFIFRAYYAMPQLTRASDGLPVGALAGFCNMLRRLPTVLPPFTHAAAVFDPPGGSFRKRLDPNYKAGRSAPPPELIAQFPLVRRAAAAFGWPIAEVADFEADDVIATLAVRGGASVTVVSSDKDLLQLLTAGVTIFDPAKNAPRTAASAFEAFGVVPELVADVQALAGDPSDGVPGVPGIGVKTAAKLINTAGSLRALLDNPDQASTPALRQKLRDHRGAAELAYELVRLRTDAPVPDLQDLLMHPPATETLRAFLQEFELQGQVRHLPSAPVRQPDLLSLNDTADAADQAPPLTPEALRAQVLKTGCCAVLSVTEGVALAASPSAGGVIKQELFAAEWIPLLREHNITVVSINTARLLPQLPQSHDLRLLEYAVTGRPGDDDDLPTEVDPALPLHLRAGALLKAWVRLVPTASREGVTLLYENVDRPAATAVADMERVGVMIDKATAAGLSAEWGASIAALESVIEELLGQKILLNSPKQLSQALFDGLQLTPPAGVKKNASGYYPTGSEVLEQLEHPVIAPLLQRRHLHKLKSTYADALPQHAGPDGRIHGRFALTGTATGRLASSEPNLQNIPAKTPEGRRLRALFIAPPGRVLITADYTQVELRLLAHIADVPGMKAAFAEHRDIHSTVAIELFGSSEPEHRRRAKTVNFGIIYGQTAFGLAAQLGVKRTEAQEFIDAYFARYPQIKDYMRQQIAAGRSNGCVRTLFGRKILTPGLADAVPARRNAAERAAINGPVQGTAADIMRRAAFGVYKSLIGQGLSARVVLQVHDELVVEAAAGEAEAVREVLQRIMPHAAAPLCRLSVELPIAVKL